MRKIGGWRWRAAQPVDDGLAMMRKQILRCDSMTYVAHESGGQHIERATAEERNTITVTGSQ
jgi:hypothetical protein